MQSADYREAAEIVYCSSSHLRLTECVPLNYCLYKIGISELVYMGCRHYKELGVIALMFFNDVNRYIICKHTNDPFFFRDVTPMLSCFLFDVAPEVF